MFPTDRLLREHAQVLCVLLSAMLLATAVMWWRWRAGDDAGMVLAAAFAMFCFWAVCAESAATASTKVRLHAQARTAPDEDDEDDGGGGGGGGGGEGPPPPPPGPDADGPTVDWDAFDEAFGSYVADRDRDRELVGA